MNEIICDKHKIRPVKIYSECVGCELEWLKKRISELEEENKKLRDERE